MGIAKIRLTQLKIYDLRNITGYKPVKGSPMFFEAVRLQNRINYLLNVIQYLFAVYLGVIFLGSSTVQSLPSHSA